MEMDAAAHKVEQNLSEMSRNCNSRLLERKARNLKMFEERVGAAGMDWGGGGGGGEIDSTNGLFALIRLSRPREIRLRGPAGGASELPGGGLAAAAPGQRRVVSSCDEGLCGLPTAAQITSPEGTPPLLLLLLLPLEGTPPRAVLISPSPAGFGAAARVPQDPTHKSQHPPRTPYRLPPLDFLAPH